MLAHLCAIAGLLAGLQAPAAERPGVTVREVSRTRATVLGQAIDPPRGAEVVTSVYTMEPGAALPDHKHPFPRYAYVLSGRLEVTIADTGRVLAYQAGDFIVEAVDVWHRGSNPGEEPVRLLVIDQVEPGLSNTIVRP